MRVRNFGTDGSNRFGTRLNKVFLSQGDAKKTDGDLAYYQKKIYNKLKQSPKTIYDSVKKFEFVTATNVIIENFEKCCVFSKWQPFIPLILGFLCMLSIVWIIAIITSTASSYDLESINSKIHKSTINETQLHLLEIDEIVEKLIEIRKHGKMMEFEDTLTLIIPKYCLDELKVPLNVKSEESFHLNVAEMIKFLANDGTFEKHQTLKLAPNGGIIDPHIADETHGFRLSDFQSCSLLDEIFRVASLNKESKSGNKHPHMPDNIDQFDKNYNFQSVEYFVDYTIKLMQGECGQLRERLEIEDQKNLVLNFFNTIKERSGNPDFDASKHYTIYVIGSDGSIYDSEPDYDKDAYYRCVPIEVVLNTNVVIEPDMTITNLRIALDKEYE